LLEGAKLNGMNIFKEHVIRRSLGIILALVWAGALSLSADAGTRKPKPINSKKHLSKLLRHHQPRYYAGFRTGLTVLSDAMAAPGTQETATPFSSTLVQVAGVDEGDIVKNDANYIYQINQGRVFVIRVFPDSNPSLVDTLDFTDGSFYPQELYLDAQRLVVVGTAFSAPPSGSSASYFSTSTVKALVYDIADPTHLIQIREVEVEGDWVASRKLGSSLYLVARKYPVFYELLQDAESRHPRRGLLPKFRDSATGGEFHALRVRDCFYFPGFDDPNYLIIAGVDLSDSNSELDVNAYLGAGELVYASTQNLYVTASRPIDIFFAAQLVIGTGPAVTAVPSGSAAAISTTAGTVIEPPEPTLLNDEERTDVYKFSLSDSRATFVAMGDVPGSILNQYSMDEHGPYFRVATTEHGWWNATGEDSNNMFVFNGEMSVVGSISDIAVGEQIYAARFLGNRAFVVTFRQIDPLFAVDLTDPANPTIVGQLTLPGYSNFLLPYDENHLIGIGKDVIVAEDHTDGDVPWWNGAAFFQGMKLAMFDVTDLHNPVLLHSVGIGDRGTESPALYDPHAILFDRPSNLLAFPVNIAQVQNPNPGEPWQWGETVFQGVQVYDVSPENGFVLRGEITQIPDGHNVWDDWDRHIDRVLFIGPDFFTLSFAQLKATDIGTLSDIATLELPPPPVVEVGTWVVLPDEDPPMPGGEEVRPMAALPGEEP
jgi:inhibitor of cysteine peptidase